MGSLAWYTVTRAPTWLLTFATKAVTAKNVPAPTRSATRRNNSPLR